MVKIVICLNSNTVYSVPDLPLCLGVLKHRAPLARGVGGGTLGIFLPKKCLQWVFAYVVQF
jgi:hypothetical protein